MTDSAAGLPASPEVSAHGQAFETQNNAFASPDRAAFAMPFRASDQDIAPASAATTAFQDQFHDYMQGRFAGQSQIAAVAFDTASGASAGADTVQVASSDSGGGSAFGSIMTYAGYITYGSLAASAFGHDDPLQLQTKATRFFQEKILHHHAIDNPQVWMAMGDALMIEQHMASQGAHFKPVKLGALKGEIKREAQNKDDAKQAESNAREANEIIKDISAGLKSPADYVLAARYLYSEAVSKADARAQKEAVDHKDERRLIGRLKLLSGETDRTDAIGARDNSVDPMLDELGARVSFRLDEAAFLDRFGSKVPELGWTQEASDLRAQAKAMYDQPDCLSQPVRRRLHERYPDILTDKPS